MYTQSINIVNLVMVTQKVSQWGNSLGIRLPQTIIRQVGWKEGSIVTIATEGNKIILSPARPKYTLDKLLKDITPDMQHDEIDWGKPVGEEPW